MMGNKGALSETEKFNSKVFTLEIMIGRDNHTFKKLVISTAQCNGRSDKGKIQKQAPVSHLAYASNQEGRKSQIIKNNLYRK